MNFTIDFLRYFFLSAGMISPVLVFFILLIVVLSLIVKRFENWKRFDALYWGFITALTVGYGDIKPRHKVSKVIALFIAVSGIMFTGILVSVTILSLNKSFDDNFGKDIFTGNHSIETKIKLVK